MGLDDKIQLFEDKRIRTAWDEEKEEWYFSIVDVVAVLTDAPDYQAARNYWKVTKKRLVDEGFEPVTSCNQLKMTAADGKKRLTDVADTEQLLRIIQSIPSHKAEPFKRWLAEVGRERIEETIRRTEEFFRSLGLTTRLHEENIGEETILEIERRFNERGAKYGENENVTGAVARKILETAL